MRNTVIASVQCLSVFFLIFALDSTFVYSHGVPLFNSPVRYEVGIEPMSVCSADFDGDGDSDLAIANNGSLFVTILLGNDDGTLERSDLDYPNGQNAIAAGDLDNDGDVDLVVSNGHLLSVFLNNGDATFQSPIDCCAGIDPACVIISELNGDAIRDLATAKATWTETDSIYVLLGNGDGTFDDPVAHGVGRWARDICSADLDNDGDNDLAVSNYGSDYVSMLLNNGDATFQHVSIPDMHYPYSVQSADFDDDGVCDLSVADSGHDDIVILLNNGNATFQRVQYDVGPRLELHCADLDGDGDTDIAALNENVYILINRSDGTFEEATSYHAGYQPSSICAADLDGDDVNDLAAISFYTDMASVVFSNGDGTFLQAASIHPHSSVPLSICTIDLDADGDDDLAMGEYEEGNLYFYQSTDGHFSPLESYSVPSAIRSMRAADFDVDGDDDIAWVDALYSNVFILFNSGGGSFPGPPVQLPAGTNPNEVRAADLDGDGVADLAAVNYNSNDLSVILSNGDGTFRAPTVYAVGWQPRSLCVADFDDDGDNDLAAANRFSNDISVLLGNGDGTFQSASSCPVSTEPLSLCSAHLDGDGHIDIIVLSDNPGKISVLLGNGDGSFQSPVSYDASGYFFWQIITTADVDNDGNADIITSRDKGDISIHFGAGDGTLNDVVYYSAGGYGSELCISDFDADGDLDIATAAGYGTILENRTVDETATMLRSFTAMLLDEAIEITWRLSVVEGRIEFLVYRSQGGRDGFMSIMGEIHSTDEYSYRFIDATCEPAIEYRYRVDVRDRNDSRTLFMTDPITMPVRSFILHQNVPNPFNPATSIRYLLPRHAHVTLDVFDTQGRHVVRLVDGVREAGAHEVEWRGRNGDGRIVSSGVYFYRITAGKQSISKKMVLLH